MTPLLLAAAVVSGVGARPAALTGGEPAAYARWLGERVLVADRAFGAPPCPTAELTSAAGRPFAPGEWAVGAAAPRAGQRAWFEQVRLSGCGRTTVHNLQVVRRGPRRWAAIATLPGPLRSTPRMQTETVQRMAGVILNGAPALPCSSAEALRSMAHTDGRVLSSDGGSWTERWPIQACGVDRTVEVTFDGRRATAVTPAWTP